MTNNVPFFMTKSFILHANEKYFDIVSTCIKSIRQYSDLPIYLYLINSDKKCNIQNVSTIRWDVPLNDNEDKYIKSDGNFYIKRGSNEIYNILIQKPLITKHALENFTDLVAYIDSDSIATPYVENIFDYFNPSETYPYFGEGIYEYLHYNGKGGADDRENLSTTLEHPISELFRLNQYNRLDRKYRQTGYFVAGKNNIDLLDEWYWMCIHPTILKNNEHYAPFHEETSLNPLLWDRKFYNGLPLVYVNGTLNTIEEVYKELGFTGYSRDIRQWLRIPAKKEDLLFFHGEKRVEVMEEMIKKINNLHQLKII